MMDEENRTSTGSTKGKSRMKNTSINLPDKCGDMVSNTSNKKKKLSIQNDPTNIKKSRSTDDVLRNRARAIFKIYREESLKDEGHRLNVEDPQMKPGIKRRRSASKSPLACTFPEQASGVESKESPNSTSRKIGPRIRFCASIESDGGDSSYRIDTGSFLSDSSTVIPDQDVPDEKWILKARELRELGDKANEEVVEGVKKIAQQLISTKVYEIFQQTVESLMDNSALISGDASERNKLALFFLCANTAANLVMNQAAPEITTGELEENVATFVVTQFPNYVSEQ